MVIAQQGSIKTFIAGSLSLHICAWKLLAAVFYSYSAAPLDQLGLKSILTVTEEVILLLHILGHILLATLYVWAMLPNKLAPCKAETKAACAYHYDPTCCYYHTEPKAELQGEMLVC